MCNLHQFFFHSDSYHTSFMLVSAQYHPVAHLCYITIATYHFIHAFERQSSLLSLQSISLMLLLLIHVYSNFFLLFSLPCFPSTTLLLLTN